ncbi:hypothetical protein [Ewingella americana]|uniref:Phage protein n=1 Tax=Ewingella americana TaxID=41202 RepID=A0A502GIU9_9GAMM|nr:hypothetical protein [Ewingella americana]TPG61488.1 hypothetical protein EAH77_12670 [Ewingella americana]
MKPVKRLYLSNTAAHLVDVNLALELSACGRGFITAQTDEDFTGKLVRLDIGYPDLVLRWFTGYVERSQPSESGYQRLFVRELVGVFERAWPCSFQHPTLRDVAKWLSEESGLEFTVPASSYADKPIPHFTHSGTGYQLLASLGRAFSINDYIWYQLPDGGVFVGSAADALFAGKSVEIPSEFSQGTAAGNTMTVPVIQTLRPGVDVNNQRLTTVRLHNDDMAITWTPRNKVTGQALQKTPIQRQVEGAFPELASGLHLPKFARVEAPSEDVSNGNIADPYRPRYAVDLQLLDADGKPAKDTPIYPAVPLPLPMAGSESGMFQFPPVGTLVEVGFNEGRPDKPFVRQTMAQGNSLPAVKPGEQLQQQRDGVSQRVTVAGDWERQTDQTISESSMRRVIQADEETRTLVTRETTIQATDKTIVLGTYKLLAGAVQQVAQGDFCLATQANYVASIQGNATTDVGGDNTVNVVGQLVEKVGQLRSSVAAVRQEVIAPVVWIGSQSINVCQLMLETLDVVKQLAELTAAHTHSNTGTPQNAATITSTGAKATELKTKYDPIIG